MCKAGKKPIIGILGGIASGKSAVAAEFVKLGCKVIDADKIAHEVLEEKTVKEKILESFDPTILDQEGKINRRKLAEIVFADAEKLALLNTIIHPLVLERADKLIKKYNKQNQVRAIVLDIPLLVEVGWHERCDKIIFVDCEPELRAKRAEKMGFNKNKRKFSDFSGQED